MDSSSYTQGRDWDIFLASSTDIFNIYAILKAMCNTRARMNIALTNAFAWYDHIFSFTVIFSLHLWQEGSSCQIAQHSFELAKITCDWNKYVFFTFESEYQSFCLNLKVVSLLDMHNSIPNYVYIGMICKNMPGEKEEEIHDQRKM